MCCAVSPVKWGTDWSLLVADVWMGFLLLQTPALRVDTISDPLGMSLYMSRDDLKKPLEIFPDGRTTICVIEGGESLLSSEGVWDRYFLPPTKYYSKLCVFSLQVS